MFSHVLRTWVSLDLKVLYKFIWKKKSHSFQVIVWLLLLPQVRENLEENSEQKNVIEVKWERMGPVGGGSGQSKCCGQRGSSCYGDSSLRQGGASVAGLHLPRASEWDHWAGLAGEGAVLQAWPHELDSNTHRVEGGVWLPQVVLPLSHKHQNMWVSTHVHTQTPL